MPSAGQAGKLLNPNHLYTFFYVSKDHVGIYHTCTYAQAFYMLDPSEVEEVDDCGYVHEPPDDLYMKPLGWCHITVHNKVSRFHVEEELVDHDVLKGRTYTAYRVVDREEVLHNIRCTTKEAANHIAMLLEEEKSNLT